MKLTKPAPANAAAGFAAYPGVRPTEVGMNASAIYRCEIQIAAVVGAASALWGGLAVAGVVPSGSPIVIRGAALVMVASLCFNVALGVAGGGSLEFPVPSRLFGRVSLGAILAFAGFMIYGIAKWPTAPLREEAGHFIDKGGHSRTREEFEAFQRWETGFTLFTVPFALCAFMPLPATKRGAASGLTTG